MTNFSSDQLQLSDEKARIGILQRHENEYKKDLERAQEKAGKYEYETTQLQYSLETITRESKEKVCAIYIVNILLFKYFISFSLD